MAFLCMSECVLGWTINSALTVSQTESCTPTMYIYGVQALGRRELRVPILLVLAREILQVQYSYRTSLCFHNEIGCCFSFMAAIQLPLSSDCHANVLFQS